MHSLVSRRHSNPVVVAMFALTATATANAAIVGTSGPVVQIAPPASAVSFALPGGPVYCWDEQSNVGVPASGLSVNLLGNGAWTGAAPFNATYFGGAVDSHMIHLDASGGVWTATGTVTFSSAIVAVIYDNALLAASDSLLGSATAYEPIGFLRSTNSSLFQNFIQVSGNQISFTIWASSVNLPNRIAEFRVLTDATVPAPGAMALLGAAGVASGRRRRR